MSTSIWDAIGERPRGGADVYAPLREEVDPRAWKPRLADDIEIKDFALRWGNSYTMIANPRALIHYRLKPIEAELVRSMDGTRTLQEIAVAHLQASGEMSFDTLADLVQDLRAGGFLDRPFIDTDAAVQRAMQPRPTAGDRVLRFLRTLTVEWKDAHRLVDWTYRHGLKHFFGKAAQVPAAVLALGGLAVFLVMVASGTHSLGVGSVALGSLIILVLNYFITFVHELGHATVLVHHGRRVKSAGFMIYFGSPSFFVESSDGLMLDTPKRVLQAFAGPYAELIIAGIASIVAWSMPDTGIGQLLYTFAALNYLILFLNLIPLLELDGYWILSDLLQMPDLRPRSLSFVQREMWGKILRRERFRAPEVGLALYGLLGIAFTIFSFYTAYFFWEKIFGDLVRNLWNGGLVTRGILLVLAVFIGGPVLRGLIALARSISRRARVWWRRIRFRVERRWRVEAAELIDALPLFDDVPVEVLNELAGDVRLRAFRPREQVVVQGDRADSFHVIRAGTAVVIEESDTGERELATLHRGDSFGELGLAEGRARAATVRAVTTLETFEVRKSAFDRLLARLASVPEFAPTVQRLAELQALPTFAGLDTRQLRDLLEHGSWRHVAPGEVILREGEVGDAFYVLASGRVRVERDGEEVAVLEPGAHFGEIALLLDVPRTASVIAVTPAEVFRLDRDAFERVLAESFRRGTLRPQVSIDRTWHH